MASTEPGSAAGGGRHETVDDMRTEVGGTPDRRRVVVGIDGSAESRPALHWALRHAEGIDGEVHAVAVWQQPIQFGAAGMPLPAQEFEAEARAWLDETLPDVAGDRARVHTHLEHGEPAGVLLDHALRAELLVLGNHGAASSVARCSVRSRCAVSTTPPARCCSCPPRRRPTPSLPDEDPDPAQEAMRTCGWAC